MPAAKSSSLRQQAEKFHQHLESIRQQIVLPPRLAWYPWGSLGQFQVLDEFLKGDAASLMTLIGNEPALDVGCGDGDIAFFLESLGARVDAVDHAPTNYNALYGVQALKEKLGSAVRIHPVDLDSRPHLPSSSYGLAIMLGVLYHLKNPFLVLQALARHCRHVFLSTRITAFTPDHKIKLAGLPVAYLVDDDELNQDDTNFWIFTEEALKRVLKRSGWDVLHFTALGPVATSDPVNATADGRAFVLARSRLAAKPQGFRMLWGWHQLEYDTWRWTERRFAAEVTLSEPMPSATLRFIFQLPEQVFVKEPKITLHARVGDRVLPASNFSVPGEHEYSASVESLPAGPITVEFELDHAIGPSDIDQRELGLLVDLSGAAPITFAAT